ncbi:MAG: hypothetical protein V1865_00975 [bacterium]
MSEFNIINCGRLSWQLMIALLGGIFAVFALGFDNYFITYGLVTFAYGVAGHVLDNLTPKKWLNVLIQIILVIIWIVALAMMYTK